MSGFFKGFHVVAHKAGVTHEILIVPHKTSVCDASAYAAKKLAMVILQVEPWQLEVEIWDGQGPNIPNVVYEVRWIGKPDMMSTDNLRFEHRVRGKRNWAVLS
jgi:hypothetical protein